MIYRLRYYVKEDVDYRADARGIIDMSRTVFEVVHEVPATKVIVDATCNDEASARKIADALNAAIPVVPDFPG